MFTTKKHHRKYPLKTGVVTKECVDSSIVEKMASWEGDRYYPVFEDEIDGEICYESALCLYISTAW